MKTEKMKARVSGTLDPIVVPVCSTFGNIWYAIRQGAGFLQPTPEGLMRVARPYTFACRENAESVLRHNKEINKMEKGTKVIIRSKDSDLGSDPLLGVPDPCKTCSDRDKIDTEEPCASCGPPAWEYHDCRDDDDTPNALLADFGGDK